MLMHFFIINPSLRSVEVCLDGEKLPYRLESSALSFDKIFPSIARPYQRSYQ